MEDGGWRIEDGGMEDERSTADRDSALQDRKYQLERTKYQGSGCGVRNCARGMAPGTAVQVHKRVPVRASLLTFSDPSDGCADG